jgi:MFS family permease
MHSSSALHSPNCFRSLGLKPLLPMWGLPDRFCLHCSSSAGDCRWFGGPLPTSSAAPECSLPPSSFMPSSRERPHCRRPFGSLLAGIGIGGEWALAGTYVAEAWPEDRRKMGAGYLQTGYYAGFLLASALNYTVAAHYGWRAMFWCGLTPVVVACMVLLRVKEPDRWQQKTKGKVAGGLSSLRRIFRPPYTLRTVVNTALLSSAICGLWSAAVYAPTAIITLAKRDGVLQPQAVRISSFGMGLLSLGTILGCLAVPPLAERFGRKRTLGFYFLGMAACILLGYGWAFYVPQGLHPFIALLFFLGFFGGNFAVFSLWLPEQYGTTVRATAFAFTTSFGRFIAAGVNFGLGALVSRMGTLGKPVAFTAIAFGIGLLVIPFAVETRGKALPD